MRSDLDASVPGILSDADAKQRAYEQAKSALEYEQTRETPSFTIPDEVDEDGNVIPFETFTPAEPTVKEITIHGERHIAFTDDSPSKTNVFVASAIDQYGDPIKPLYEWTGADGGVLVVDNVDGTYDVTATAGDVTESITVTVRSYIAPSPPPQPEIDHEDLALYEAIAGLEERMTQVEGGHE